MPLLNAKEDIVFEKGISGEKCQGECELNEKGTGKTLRLSSKYMLFLIPRFF